MSETSNPVDPLDAASLVLLDTPVAQKLAAAWPRLKPSERSDIAKWAAVAAVEAFRAKTIAPALRRCGICRDDGTTSPLALQYLTRLMLGTTGRPKRSR